MKQLKHWQDAVNLVLGAWRLAGPVALGAPVQRQWPGHARRRGNRHPDRGSRAVHAVDRQGLQRLAARAHGALLGFRQRRLVIRLSLALQPGRAHSGYRLRRRYLLSRAAPVA